MTERIEIRHDGEIVANRLPVGKASFSVPFPHEFVGDWFIDDPDDALRERIDSLKGEIECLEEEADERDGRIEELEDAERDLESLRDEVRAFLASETPTNPTSLQRLKDALGDD